MFYFKLNFLIAITLLTIGGARAKNIDDNGKIYEVEIDNMVRTYTIKKPKVHTNHKAIIVLHGGGGNANQIEKSTHFTELALPLGYTVVYPNGTSKFDKSVLGNKLLTWNAIHCCGYAKDNKVNDIGFIDNLIDELRTQHEIEKIYIAGMSNGAMMSYQAAIQLNGKIDAIAPVVGNIFIDQKELPKNQISVIIINGMKDFSIPYNGGLTQGKFSRSWDSVPLKSVDDTFHFFTKSNNCSIAKEIENQVFIKHSTICNNKTEIQSYLVKDGGHSWYGFGNVGIVDNRPIKDFNATEVIIDFFNKH